MSTPPARVRVVVADDHPLYRESVVRAVKDRPEFDLVGEVADGRAALTEIARLRPDVAVLDFRMPELDALQILNAIERDALGTRVVLLSAFLEGALVYEAMAAGAAAYLSKETDRRELCDAIAVVARGGTVLDADAQIGLAGEVRARGRVERPTLTPREHEILVHVSEGRGAPEIGTILHLSPATIKGHLQSIYEKLGVSERAAAVAEAMRRGLLE